MKLLLLRKEKSRSGRCLLSYRNRPWSRLLENRSGRQLLPDGLYRMVWDYEETRGWYLRLLDGTGKKVARIFPTRPHESIPPGDFSPVEHFRPGTKFSKLAFIRLGEKLRDSGDEEWNLEVATVDTIGF